MAGTVVADTLEAASTSTLVLKNGVANTPPTIQDSGGTEIGKLCRAFVNFNGTGTVAIRASFNVSSITDNGTGNYTANLTTAMPDVNYSTTITTASSNGSNTGVLIGNVGTVATTSVQIFVSSAYVSGVYSATAFDVGTICVSVFR